MTTAAFPVWPQLFPEVPHLNLVIDEGDNDPIAFSGSPIPIIRLTGESGSGKTWFGMGSIACQVGTLNPPIVIWDYEAGSTYYERQFALARHDMTKPSSPKQAYLEWREHVKAIKPGQYAVAIIDTAEEWEQGLRDYVMENPKEYRYTPGQFADKYGKPSGLYWGAAKGQAKSDLRLLLSKVQIVFVINHLSQVYDDGGIPIKGKKTPKGSQIIGQLATLELWLVGNGQGKPPTGHVRKCRLNILDWSDVDDYGVPAVKPLLPNTLPIATMNALREYLKQPGKGFSVEENKVADPSNMPLTADEKIAAETARMYAEIELSKLHQADEVKINKRKMMNSLIKSGVFMNDAQIGAAVGALKSQGIVFGGDMTLEEYSNHLTAKSREIYPIQFSDPIETPDLPGELPARLTNALQDELEELNA